MSNSEELRNALTDAETAVSASENLKAIRILQEAAAHASTVQNPNIDHDRLHGDICLRLGSLLAEVDRLPESMQAYQEAVDCYGRVPGAESKASLCARKIVSGVKELWRRPDRLYLLIARYDRERRQLEQRPGTEAKQADLSFKTATILQRRDRFDDSVIRYSEALSLYLRVDDTEMKQALCHHRLAGLYQYELESLDNAVNHYREAVRLYRDFEPMVDGEQMNRALCEELLRNLLAERMLQR